MQIVTQGTVPESPTKDAQCGVCKSILRYTQHDMRIVGEVLRPRAWITCPVCRCPIDVPVGGWK